MREFRTMHTYRSWNCPSREALTLAVERLTEAKGMVYALVEEILYMIVRVFRARLRYALVKNSVGEPYALLSATADNIVASTLKTKSTIIITG